MKTVYCTKMGMHHAQDKNFVSKDNEGSSFSTLSLDNNRNILRVFFNSYVINISLQKFK